MKSVPFEIAGKTYGLNYTVRATREIDENFGGVEKLTGITDDNVDVSAKLERMIELIDILLRGGLEHDRAEAELMGMDCASEEPPELDLLKRYYTLADMNELMSAALLAIRGGQKTTVKIEDTEKNAEATPDQ